MTKTKPNVDKMFEDLFGFGKAQEIPVPQKEPEAAPAPVAPPVRSPPKPPENWDPPSHLECGHWNFQQVAKPADPEAPVNHKVNYEGVWVKSPEDCHDCQAGKPGHPRYQTGKYRVPVAKGKRRTLEKEHAGGWSGFCCDEEGYYIGGISNDCRRENLKGPWCEVHARKTK